MELKLANARIKVLEEANDRLSAMINFLLSQPGPAALEYQKLLQESQKEIKKVA